MSFIHAVAISIFAAFVVTSSATAQTYPDRPVKMLVAFPPGGADDATARILQDPMQKALGQPIVIENVGGAGGMIAAAKAARAEPDGYTILLHQNALAAGMALYPDHTFDAEKDFVPIGLVNTTAVTLAARPSLPPNNFDALLRWMKEPGQTIRVGHPGVVRTDLGRRGAALGRCRQAQNLRGYHQKAVRWPTEAEYDDPARL